MTGAASIGVPHWRLEVPALTGGTEVLSVGTTSIQLARPGPSR